MSSITSLKPPHNNPARDEDGLTASEMLASAGITYRELDYWLRCGFLKPLTAARGHGYPYRWSTGEALIAEYGRQLIGCGFHTETALRHARRLVETGHDIVIRDGCLTMTITVNGLTS